MPYIPAHHRKDALRYPITPGDLNFAITKLLIKYVRHNDGKISYQLINDCLGALEGAKLEFQRRIVADYEDKAIERNGDVY